MKKAFLILFLMPGILSNGIQAQINIVSGDLPVIGDTLPSAKDTTLLDGMAAISFNGTAGANQVWNFALTPHQLITTYAVAPNTTPDGSAFPSATISYTSDMANYSYNKLTASVYTSEGFSGELLFGISAVVDYTNTYDQYRFSVDYLDSYSDDYAFTEMTDYDDLPVSLQTLIDDGIDASGFGGLVDEVLQLRLRFSSNFTHTVDAWGTVTTPIGTYNCLRQKRDESSSINIDVQIRDIFTSESWIDDVFAIPVNTTNYEWLTKVTKQPVVTLDIEHCWCYYSG